MLRFLILLVVLLASATQVTAQTSSLADFSDHGVIYGGYNFGARYQTATGTAADVNYEGMAVQIQNDRWIITGWLSGTTYRYRTLDKQTGYYDGYVSTLNMVGSDTNPPPQVGTNIPNAIAVGTATTTQDALGRAIRPDMCFTSGAGANFGYDGMAVALIQGNDVWVHFFRIDPNSLPPAGSQPLWIEDTLRSPVNVSATGSASNPNVKAMVDGTVVVSWIDSAPVGAIGGKTGINPSTGNDVYIRRFNQSFADTSATVPVAVPGLVDSSAGNLVG